MTDIHERLAGEHRRLDGLFQLFAAAAGSDDQRAKRVALADFETTLVTHFEGEEKYLFPLLEAEFPEEVLALREEHELIRRQVGDLMESDHLNCLNAELANELVAALRKHARREDNMLYALVNEQLGSKRYQELVSYLEDTYAKLRGIADD